MLVSTMYQDDVSLIEKMNVVSDAIIINQTEDRNDKEIFINEQKTKFLSFKERGLSISRNRAIDNATADICVFADDDIVYKDGYADIILNSYKEHEEADLIIFQVDFDYKEKKYPSKTKKIGFFSSLKVTSNQISFRLSSIKNADIRFNTSFGAGSNKYISGEENIFLIDCLKKGLNIIYVPKIIAKVYKSDSTWFRGFDKNYFISKGAFYKKLLGPFYIFGILYFSISKYLKYKEDSTITKSIKYMIEGARDYEKTKS